MKELVAHVRAIAAVSAFFAVQCFAQPQGVPTNGVSTTAESDYAITQVGPDSVVWRNSAGQTVTSIATGMNYSTDGGQTWLPSDNSFTISADGSSFVADKLRDPTTLAANINQQAAVSAITPEGATMSSSPTAIVLYDAASGLSAIVGTITNSIGVQVDAQHVVYTNAFSSSLFSASIVYSLPDPGSFHQDVIFTGFNPNFDPTAYGFAAEATNTLQIELLTEFFSAPQPMAQERDLYIEQDPNVRASMASPDFIDFTLDFGHYVFGPGRAYTTSSLPGAGIGAVVVKDFVNTNGRSFLVESLKYKSIAGYLQSLPPTKTTAALTPPPHARKRLVAWEGIPSLKGKGPKARAMKIAGLTPRGVDVDYIATVSSTVEPKLYTSDTTYFVTNTVYLNSPVTIESAVFKFPINQGTIEIGNTLTLVTTNYRTAIFTSADDNSAGINLGTNIWGGYTGTNTGHKYGSIGLWLNTSANVTLNNLRFCFMTIAVQINAITPQQVVTVSHTQVIDCDQGIYVNGNNTGSLNLYTYNDLIANVGTLFPMAEIILTNGGAFNCTIDNCSNLFSVDQATTGKMGFTNSIFSTLKSTGGSSGHLTVTGSSNVFYNSSSTSFGTFHTLSVSPYATNGAGNYYITNNISYLTNGTANVPASLLPQLKMKTTQAPLWLTNLFTNSTTLTPVLARDSAGVALGFHYDPIDFIASFQVAVNSTITLLNGVAIAYKDSVGIQVRGGDELISLGSPTNRNYLVYYNLVQEQPILLDGSLALAGPISTGGPNSHAVSLRFTTICAPTGQLILFNTGDAGMYDRITSLTMQDCEVYGSGAVWQMSETNTTPTFVLSNNLFYRVPFSVASAATITAVNNLFYGSTNTNEFSISIKHLTTPSPNTNQNNVYDGVSVALDGSTVGYNAYLHGAVATLGGTNTDLTNNVTWVAGPLGNFYQPSGSPLLNSGSQSAANLGLYHYTVLTNEAIEGSSTVSRGYHYIALGSGGAPLDNNSDGYPDYLADTNGDGINNDSEAWTNNSAPGISIQPVNQYAVAGSAATFTVAGYGTATLTYQWFKSGSSISGATLSAYTISSVGTSDAANYTVTVSNSVGPVITSSVATLTILLAPQVTSISVPTNVPYWFQTALDSLSASVSNPFYGSATPAYYSQYLDPYLRYQETYQWQSNSVTMLSGIGVPSSYAPSYEVVASTLSLVNTAGSTNITWTNLLLANPGMVETWGEDDHGESDRPVSLTNTLAIAVGEYQSTATTDSGSVVQWGAYANSSGGTFSVTNYVAASPPPQSNVVAVAAGQVQALALLANSTVYSWGLLTNGFGWNVTTQPNLTNVTAIACGTTFDMALSNGTVVAWGSASDGETSVPSYLSNVVAIAAHGYHGMALQSNGTVVTWGTVPGNLTNPPPLTNPVTIATGNAHFLALQSNGRVVAWGDNTDGQCTVPSAANQGNVMAIAAGDYFSMALLNNGKIIEWGDNTYGQTNMPASSTNHSIDFKLIAAGGNQAMAGIWSSWVQYPINVARDLLLIYNTNSLDSYNVCQYYLSHRPMVSNANVLKIGCASNNETIYPSDFISFEAQITNWLYQNPTKRPSYVILFQDIPARVSSSYGEGGLADPSVQYQLHYSCSPGWFPFVTAINMNGTGGVGDCTNYINKLVSVGSNQPGRLILSGHAAGFGNNNYYFDDGRLAFFVTQGYPTVGYNAELGVLAANPAASITYKDIAPDANLSDHITSGSNLAGYLCWGTHSVLGTNYATNSTVNWTSNSGWWIIRTVESFNGDRLAVGFGNFLSWFASDAFGGVNYANTPVGAVSYTDEPDAGATVDATYFGLWESGKNFAICAWNSINTQTAQNFYPQNVGDPFVIK